jgi:hypothetical protein
MNRIVRFGIPFVGCAVVSIAVLACSSDSKSGGNPADGVLPRRLFAERSRRLRDGPHWGGAFAFRA